MSHNEENQAFDVRDGTRIVVESTSGRVSVVGMDQANVTFTGDRASAVLNEGKDELHIRTGHGGSHRLKVYVPHSVDVLVRSASGDVRLKELNGRITIKTMSGDVTASALQGDMVLQTVSGDAYIARSRLDAIDAHTVSGDLIIETPLDQEGDYSMTSVSGDVRLRVPEDQKVTVTCNSLSGEFSCRLPHEMDERRLARSRVLVNGGGVPVFVSSTSGDLRIEPAKEILEDFESETEPEPEPVRTEPSPYGTKPLDASDLEPETTAASEPRFDPDLATEPDPQPFGLDDSEGSPENQDVSEAVARMSILRSIEEGKMSVSEGLAKLRELE